MPKKKTSKKEASMFDEVEPKVSVDKSKIEVVAKIPAAPKVDVAMKLAMAEKIISKMRPLAQTKNGMEEMLAEFDAVKGA